MLDNYEHAPEDGKKIIEGTASLAAQSGLKKAERREIDEFQGQQLQKFHFSELLQLIHPLYTRPRWIDSASQIL